MDIRLQDNFVIHAEALLGEIWVPVVLIGMLPRHGPDVIRLSILANGSESIDQAVFNWMKVPGEGPLAYFHRPIQLRGETPYGEMIWVPQFQLTEFSTNVVGHEWKGVARTFIRGQFSNSDDIEGKISCSVFIPYIPLFERIQNIDVSAASESRDEEICWRIAEAEARLTMEDNICAGEKTRFNDFQVNVKRYLINLQTQGSLKTFLEQLEDLLGESFLLISLLCREYITWYAAEVGCSSQSLRLYKGDSAEGNNDQSTLRDKFRVFDVPVSGNALRDGLFQMLLTGYHESQHSNVIRRTIPHLLMSGKRGYVEGQLGSVYSALESLVDGLSEHAKISYLLGSAQFKKLSKTLQMAVSQEIQEQAVAEGIINKLTELRRRAFFERLMMLLQRYDLSTTLDWILQQPPPFPKCILRYQSSSEVYSAMQDALKRRNILIHQGKMEDKHCDDLPLLRNIIEIWILKLLGCPDSAINTHAYPNFWQSSSSLPS